MIGNGIDKLVERAFAAHGLMLATRDLGERRVRMTGIYGRNLTRLTTLRPGARQALAAATGGRGDRSASSPTSRKVSRGRSSEHFGLLGQLRIVIGGDSGYARKPAPDMLLAACDACRCSVGEAVLVGDSPVDAGAARAAGMTCIIVRGGYTDVAGRNAWEPITSSTAWKTSSRSSPRPAGLPDDHPCARLRRRRHTRRDGGMPRQCFNQAFAEHGLDWTWDRSLYTRLLAVTGGRERIAITPGRADRTSTRRRCTRGRPNSTMKGSEKAP